jgi:CDP-4-dehydro-6-deoxyglucose reductase, E3
MLNFSKPVIYKAKLIEKTPLTAKVFRARYELVDPQTVSFYAGQTIMLKVGGGINRAMSIASPPQDTTVITSVQDVSPGGPGSRWMIGLNLGDTVEFMAPLGRFVVDHESTRKKIFVATGTGIAPFRSMLLDNTDNRVANEDISLYWGLRHEEDAFLCDELKREDEARDKLIFYFTLSQPSDNWQGLRGHVTDHVFKNETDLKNCDFYLCGNRKMLMEMQEKLIANGVSHSQMKFDPFY